MRLVALHTDVSVAGAGKSAHDVYLQADMYELPAVARITYAYPQHLQSVERVRLHLLAHNIQAFPSPNPRSKAQQRTSVQPGKVARQLKSTNPPLQACRQLESRIWGARMLKSMALIILSKHPSIQASKHPSIHASSPRGRRQRR